MKDSGVISVNKPKDWTSHDVVAKLRTAFGVKRIGHTGTLDPMATGVLPICIGKATRMIEYYDEDIKSYHATMKLGKTSDTLDITGQILSGYDFSQISEDDILRAFEAYTGWIEQIPPKFSAIRINGQRAYDLARQSQDFEIKARKVFIKDIKVCSIDLCSGDISFDVWCSKGTYIRTICDDIGKSLGCGAIMTELCRTSSGVFTLEDSTDLQEILDMTEEEREALILPIDKTLSNLGIAELADDRVKFFLNGNETGRIGYSISKGGSVYRVYNKGLFLGTASIDSKGELKALKVVVDR